jgi:hypothetical protein
MADFEEISAGKGTDIPQIEEQGPILEEKRNEQPGIIKRIIDQPGMKAGAH